MPTRVSVASVSTANVATKDLALERRRRTRTQVHWRLYFWGGPLTEALETVTQDLSSDGFYCFSRIPFIPGEQLVCMLRIPAHRLDRSDQGAELECQVQVVRVDPVSEDGHFGIGCKIEDYRLTRTVLPGRAVS
jgi:hypothetical protein